MTIEVKVPVLPESVEDATIAGWHKKPGDTIRRDENLVDLETDKVVLEVPAPAAGTIQEIKASEGDTVNSDDVIAIIEEGAIDAPVQESPPTEAEAPAAPAVAEPAVSTADTPKLSPSARRVAEEENVDPGSLEGTGRGGRVTKGDVLNFIKGGGSRLEERVKMTRLRSRVAERMKEAQNTAAILTLWSMFIYLQAAWPSLTAEEETDKSA
jgi:2-oxoglutarate dehydrogenase E2 component (dihydrolipoamide succinyltransferase)